MKNRRNYYRILHVQPDAPSEIIKSSYRTLMLKLNRHPDRGGDHWNAAMINEAYEILTDPIKRARYDLTFKYKDTDSASSKNHTRRETERKTHDASSSHREGETARKQRCVFCLTPYALGLRKEQHAECHVCRSPLFEAQRLQRCGSSKRVIARIKHEDEMCFYTKWPQKSAFRAKIRDLSPQGLQFLSRKVLVENQVIKLDSDTLHATARIVCCIAQIDTAGRYYRIGAEFLTLRFNHSRGTFLSAQV